MSGTLKNIIVCGASYVGRRTAIEIAKVAPVSHRVLLIDPNSHFNHLFVFPRFAVIPGHEHKAFIPYAKVFGDVPDGSRHTFVTAKVQGIHRDHVTLDTPFEGSTEVPYSFLTIATGTMLSQPSRMPGNDKASSVDYLRTHQNGVKKAKDIVIVGGGAVGVQMATDIKEWFPEKNVTVVQSRDKLMPRFDGKLHEIVKKRFDELGINLFTNARVQVPPEGVPNDGTPITLPLNNGSTITTDFLILATGQKPNTQLLSTLTPSSPGSLINPENGFVRVKETMQLQDPAYPNIFAVGDIADSGAGKTVRSASGQMSVVPKNIVAMIEGKEPTEKFTPPPQGIHLSLGKTSNVVFGNPVDGNSKPYVDMKNDGVEDFSIDNFWTRMGFKVRSPSEYHL